MQGAGWVAVGSFGVVLTSFTLLLFGPQSDRATDDLIFLDATRSSNQEVNVIDDLVVALERAVGSESSPTRGALQDAPAQAPDDDRVEVQLVVLGVAIGLVVVLGSLAYLVRKKLGLVAPPPDPSEGGHDAH